jgi:hypothetical protein
MSIVDATIARRHVKLGPDEFDPLVDMYLGAAEVVAAEFMGRNFYADLDSLAAAVLAGTAGPDPILVDDAICAAVLLIFGHLYTNREDVVVGVTVAQLPRGAQSLLQPKRINMGI